MDPVPLEPYSNKLKNDGYSEEDALIQDNDKNSSTGNYYETLLVPAAGLALLAYSGYNFNPQDNEIKKGITPILLLHGSGFNESEFVVARYYLNQPKYGSVFSLNIEGILSRDPTKGIDDYAFGIVGETIKKIITLTQCNSVIPIGHSMGGMIAMFYAEYFSEEDQIEVKHAFPIASPIKYRIVGHHGIIALPTTWIWINSKLDNIYLDNVEETGIV